MLHPDTKKEFDELLPILGTREPDIVTCDRDKILAFIEEKTIDKRELEGMRREVPSSRELPPDFSLSEGFAAIKDDLLGVQIEGYNKCIDDLLALTDLNKGVEN